MLPSIVASLNVLSTWQPQVTMDPSQGVPVPQALQMIGTTAIAGRGCQGLISNDLCWHCGEERNQKVRIPASHNDLATHMIPPGCRPGLILDSRYYPDS